MYILMKGIIRWAANPAEYGYVQAQGILGVCYFSGKGGLKIDLSKAISLISKSAEQGHIAAKAFLATCYEQGKGVKKNKEKAFSLYREAANAGDIYAQRWMGLFYHEKYFSLCVNGKNLQKGIRYKEYLRMACDWYEKAAQQGDELSEKMLNECRDLLYKIDSF